MLCRHETQGPPARASAPRARRWASCREFTGRENTVLLEQRPDIGLPAAEIDESFQRIPAAAAGKDGIQKAMCGLAVEHAVLLECGERVGCEHLGPFVAVVAGCVATGEDVPEA